MILVTGASGNVGSELVGLLAAGKQPVRALIPDAESAGGRPGVEYVGGDLNRPETLTDAFAGVEALFLLGGFADMPGVLAQARKAGAAHVVLLSSRSVVGGHPDNAVVRMHLTSEAAVHESGLGWTVLRASGFMSNTLQWRGQLRSGDVVRVPFGDVPIATIDPHDIAACAAAVLGREEHYGREHALSGPAALLPADQLAVLAEALGRPLRLQAQPDDEARTEMSRTTPPEFVDAFFRFFVNGEFDDTPILPTVEQLTGRPARTYSEWVEAHMTDFA